MENNGVFFKKCVYCNTEFTTIKFGGNRKYCSDKCKIEYQKSQEVLKKCLYCGSDFLTKKCHSDRRKFCSQKCRDESYGGRFKNHVEKTCMICGKTFMVKTSHSLRRKYCGKQCQNKAYETKYQGVNNPNYRGVVSDDGYKYMFDGKRIHIHKHVVLKYLGIKNIDKKYHIHHRDDDRGNNNIENLVILHTSDHRRFHHYMGSIMLYGYSEKLINKEQIKTMCSKEEFDFIEQIIDLTVIKQLDLFDPHIFENEYDGKPIIYGDNLILKLKI